MMTVQNPRLDEYLPGLMQFVNGLSDRYLDGDVTNWEQFKSQVDQYFSAQPPETLEEALPGWDEMSRYADGLTRAHTIGVMLAVMTASEYKEATEIQKDQLAWSGLLHDIAKVVINRRSDLTHAFRSAGDAARVLVRAGFQHNESADLEDWIALIKGAIRIEDGRELQDNRKLPEIMAGLDAIFSGNPSAVVILKAILFHWSFTTIKEWPCAAPLNEDEVRAYLDMESLEILSPLILADSDSWNLFDRATRQRYRDEIAESLLEIKGLLHSYPDP